jgi:G3E family GTPase
VHTPFSQRARALFLSLSARRDLTRRTQNKWEHVSERALDDVIERLNTLNDTTPKVRCVGTSVDPALVFGLDTRLFLPSSSSAAAAAQPDHHDEVETATIWRGMAPPPAHGHEHKHGHEPGPNAGLELEAGAAALPALDEAALTAALGALPAEGVYRVKGFVRLDGALRILNWAFGRHELLALADAQSATMVDVEVRLTVMGERGEVRRAARAFAGRLGALVC